MTLLDDLPAMALFAQVVQLRSFSAAARADGIVKSAVSKRIATLEARLGVRLLVRTTRKLALTSEGLAFYEHCAAMVAAARAAAESVGEAQSNRGTVRLNASGTFAEDRPMDRGPAPGRPEDGELVARSGAALAGASGESGGTIFAGSRSSPIR